MAEAVSSPSERVLRYTTGAIILHWAIAVLIIGQVIGGVWMVSAAYDDNAANDLLAFNAYQLHKTFGLLVLVLSVARLVWRFAAPPPPPPPMPGWQGAIANATHIVFYGLMIGVPLLGWLMVSVSPREVPTLLFNSAALPWPHLPGFGALSTEAREHWEALFAEAHEILAFATMGLLFLHVGAALKHQFVDRDRLLARMVPRLAGATRAPTQRGLGWGPMSALIIAPLALGVAFGQMGAARSNVEITPAANTNTAAIDSAQASANAWIVVPEESALTFSLQYQGRELSGTIADWSADIQFSPDQLDKARARVLIGARSIATGDGYVDGLIPGGDGLQADAHPQVQFETQAFRRVDANAYEADATITLRGISKTVVFPFTVDIDGETARMEGVLQFDRFDFELGRINDPDGAYLGPQVVVSARVTAQRPE